MSAVTKPAARPSRTNLTPTPEMKNNERNPLDGLVVHGDDFAGVDDFNGD